MRYTVIMKTSSGWWMVLITWTFCLCMGSIVFTVTNLIENHECTSLEYNIYMVCIVPNCVAPRKYVKILCNAESST